MRNPNIAVGEMIRAYRKSQNLTLIDLAQKIHKSKATLSKYEKGQIPIDIPTLFEISDALGIPASRFVEIGSSDNESNKLEEGSGFFYRRNVFYVYFFDGRVNKVRKNMIELSRDKEGNNIIATLFFNLSSFDNPQKCKSLFYGTAVYHEMIAYFNFDNQRNHIEKLGLYAVDSLGRTEYISGIISGISNNSLMPTSIKCILSDHIISDEKRLKEITMLNKNEIKSIKQLNMLTVFSTDDEPDENAD